MGSEKRDFDKEAVSWDDKSGRVKLANDIADAISEQIPLTSDMDALDFGCGTGLLTFRLQPLVPSITGADSSQGMLDVFKAKVDKQNLTNLTARYLDLDKGDALAGDYQLVVSSMTLHHVEEIRPLLDQFHRITASSGYLCIADLDLDDGRFHSDNTGVFHFGFDRATLRHAFMEVGFTDVRDITAAEVIKPVSKGGMRRFTVFLMIGRKESRESG